MLNDLQIAQLLQSQYDGENVFDKIYTINGDSFAIKKESDCLHILFEGSHCFLNWWDNFQAIMIYPAELNGAGVEEGFWRNLPAFFEAVEPELSSDILISCEGHSRGAALADAFAALLVEKGYHNIQCVTFGRPNPGDEALAQILAPYRNHSYWNYASWFGHDPVGDGPPHLIFPFTQTSQRLVVTVIPPQGDQWGDFMGYHHLSNYVEGLANGQS